MAERSLRHLSDEGLLAQLATARIRLKQTRETWEAAQIRTNELLLEALQRHLDHDRIAKAGSLDD